MKKKRVGEKIYFWLLFLYPSRYRHEYGELMIQLFRDIQTEIEESSTQHKGFKLWQLIIPDFCVSVFQEHSSSITSSLPFIMKAHTLLGSLNLVCLIPLVFMMSTMSTMLYSNDNTILMILMNFLFLCIIINCFFAYKLFFFYKHQNRNYIYGSLFSIISIIWVYVIWGGFTFSLLPFFPLSVIILLMLILISTWRYAKGFAIVFSIITLYLTSTVIATTAKEQYCTKKIGQLSFENDISGAKMRTSYYECKAHNSLYQILKESYLSIY